jgi:hypothetical protein
MTLSTHQCCCSELQLRMDFQVDSDVSEKHLKMETLCSSGTLTPYLPTRPEGVATQKNTDILTTERISSHKLNPYGETTRLSGPWTLHMSCNEYQMDLLHHKCFLRAGRPGDWGSIPGRGKVFFL